MLNSRSNSDSGFTLVELLVVIGILAIVGGIVTTTIVRSLQVTHRAQQRAESLATLQNSLQRIGREVRAADPLRFDLVSADSPSQELALAVRRSSEVHLVRYYVDGGSLVEDRTILDLDGNQLATVSGRLLVNDVQGVLFEYYDDVDEFDVAVSTPAPGTIGNPIDCDDLTDGDCRASYELTNYIRITLVTDLIRTADQEIQTLVSLRNAA